MKLLGKFFCLIGAGLVAALGSSAAVAQELPPLPDDIQEKGVVRVGTKCDYPPDGYLDENGNPAGIEVEMAHQLAEYAFGSKDKVEFTCVTSSNRVPALVGDKVDLLIATMGITPERAEVVDFTKPYAWGASSVIVPADSEIQSIEDFEGKTIGLVKGSWQIPWWDENMPNTEQMRLNTVSDIVQAMTQGRVAGYAHDVAVQMALAQQNENLRLLDDRYKIGTRGAAVRKGADEWVNYLNAAFAKMAEENLFGAWIRQHADPEMVDARMKLWDVSQMPEQASSN